MISEEADSQPGPGLHKTMFAKKSNMGKYQEMVIGDQGRWA